MIRIVIFIVDLDSGTLDEHEQQRGVIKRTGDLVLTPVLHCDCTCTVDSGPCRLFRSVVVLTYKRVVGYKVRKRVE